MKHCAAAFVAMLGLTTEAHAGGSETERIEPYAVTGGTGFALYTSIGERGPTAGKGHARAIAYTDFRLTWHRRYVKTGGACVLSEAVPTLTIIYRLPKPAGPLPPGVQASWDRFHAGIVEHEKHHAEIIRKMTAKIEQESLGLRAEDDPRCDKVHRELALRLARIVAERDRQNADFDGAEMSPGGNVQTLVLALVNGD